MNTPNACNQIPVTLLTGFLGSGKTTVLNHLVRQPELSAALVIINEFGEQALDHMLVAHSTENLVMEMSSGCLCCSIRGDLVQTLRDIAWRFSRNGKRQFERVLIETTGLADPAPIIHTLMTDAKIAPIYQLDGIVTTIDMASGSNTLDQHEEAVKQAAVADAVLLTKSDLVGDVQRTALISRLRKINPAAPRWEIHNGEVAPSKLLNLGLFNADGKTSDVARWLNEEAYETGSQDNNNLDRDPDRHDHDAPELHNHHGHDHLHGHDGHHHDLNRHDDHIRAFCFSVEEPIPEEMLAKWLDVLMAFVGSKILRVKGILNIEGQEQPVIVHGVQHIFHPPTTLPAWPNEDHRSRLVFITRDVDKEAIETTFRAFRKVLPQPGEVAA